MIRWPKTKTRRRLDSLEQWVERLSDNLDGKADEIDIDGLDQKVEGISDDLTALESRVDDLED